MSRRVVINNFPENHRGAHTEDYQCGIKLYRSELEFDIKKNLHMRDASVLTSDDDDYISRQIDTAVKRTKEKLKWAVLGTSRMTDNEIYTTPTEYNIQFEFTEGWLGSPDNLCNDVHNYVVNYVIADYLLAKGNPAFAQYKAIADDWLYSAMGEKNSYEVSVSFQL